MRTGRGAVGVIGVDADVEGPLLSPERRRLFDALSDQAALAIERVHLVEDLDRSKRNAETDRLRTALLTSISHDLRTPLAAILGATGTLKAFSAKLAEAQKTELVATIDEEAERLNRFIANLLDMTRLESGAIRPRLAAQDLADLVGAALKRAATILAGHRVTTRLAADLPMVELDAVLFEQALFNLLDNAAKYSEAGGTITIAAARDAGTVVITVVDDGPGIPDGHAETIFDKFYRIEKGDLVRPGTGLGLGIARGFVEAMGGSLTAGNRADAQGAAFTIRLPLVATERPPP
jgi:two-component system sensor histidine kinase KdpD